MSWAHDVIGVPLNETISSPGWSPALRAGVTGSASVQARPASASLIAQSETALTVVVASWTPKPMMTIENSTTAMTTLTIGPPDITISFCHHGLR